MPPEKEYKAYINISSGEDCADVCRWMKVPEFDTKYREITCFVMRNDGAIGTICLSLRRSSVPRDPDYPGKKQIDIMQVSVSDAHQREGIFLRTCTWLSQLADKVDRGVFLECAHSQSIQNAIHSKNHVGHWQEVCPESHNYIFRDSFKN